MDLWCDSSAVTYFHNRLFSETDLFFYHGCQNTTMPEESDGFCVDLMQTKYTDIDLEHYDIKGGTLCGCFTDLCNGATEKNLSFMIPIVLLAFARFSTWL